MNDVHLQLELKNSFMENIIYLDHQKKSITGGHKYNDAFESYLEQYTGIRIDNEPCLSSLYTGFRKLFAPFIELKRLCKMKPGDVIFWGDTSYKYHILLFLINKLFCRTRNVCIIHHFLWLGNTGFKNWLHKLMMKVYYSGMDCIIVPSPYTKAVAENTFPNSQIQYIPLPFEKIFMPSDNYEVGNLLYVGTIEDRKGLKYLLKAMVDFQKCSDIKLKLHVVGKVVDENYKQSLDSYIKENDLNVHFLGRVSDEQLDECYRRAEVFAFPSKLEGYGIVLIEAFQRGLPIVCFNNSAMPYTIIDEENGYLAKNLDSHDFAMKLMKICNCNEERIRIQKGIKKTIDNIKTQSDFEKGIRDFWNSILK